MRIFIQLGGNPFGYDFDSNVNHVVENGVFLVLPLRVVIGSIDPIFHPFGPLCEPLLTPVFHVIGTHESLHLVICTVCGWIPILQ